MCVASSGYGDLDVFGISNRDTVSTQHLAYPGHVHTTMGTRLKYRTTRFGGSREQKFVIVPAAEDGIDDARIGRYGRLRRPR